MIFHNHKVKQYTGTELGITRSQFPTYILDILDKFNDNGFQARLVGGCIRDLLLGNKPKDFDIATNATPVQITKIFKRSEIIGKRFVIVHIIVGRMRIEVTTYRGEADADSTSKQHHQDKSTGLLLKDNCYGDEQQDAARRDFTCNALYYDAQNNIVYDYFAGVQAIKNRKLILIGIPQKRFSQDPVRMLRLVRFITKLGFSASEELMAEVQENAALMNHVSPGRLYDEVNKLILNGYAYDNFMLLADHDLLNYMFSAPALAHYFQHPELIDEALYMTDQRVNAGKPVIAAYFYALFLWPVVEQKLAELNANIDNISNVEKEHKTAKTTKAKGKKKTINVSDVNYIASEYALMTQLPKTSMIRRVSTTIREIWQKQFQLTSLHPVGTMQLLEHPRFRAAYDMFVIRSKYKQADERLANFWTKVQTYPSLDEKREYLQNFINNNPDYVPKAKANKRKRRRKKTADK